MKQHDAHTNIKPEASEPSENKEYAELLGPHGSGLHTSSRSTSAPSVANGADVLYGVRTIVFLSPAVLVVSLASPAFGFTKDPEDMVTPLIVHNCGQCAHHATAPASLHTDRSSPPPPHHVG